MWMSQIPNEPTFWQEMQISEMFNSLIFQKCSDELRLAVRILMFQPGHNLQTETSKRVI